jgi:hypothetical protein
MRKLPYPGHKWFFTQHAIAINASTLYGLLKCASPFQGAAGDYGAKITGLMVEEGILTANERDGRPDAWRDYQQVLAELGLIYSTLISPVLTFTEVGHMYLAGEIGFSEMIGAQAFSFQYPNGQKSTIQSGLKKTLVAHNQPIPNTLIELHAQHGVLLKPAVLILRLLLELHEKGQAAQLSASECQAFLMPCAKNSEWPQALAEVLAWRKSSQNIDNINHYSRRNILDWFKFLIKSDIFHSSSAGKIGLSTYAIKNLASVKQLCIDQEAPGSFWIPTTFTKKERLAWFDWYGHVPYTAQRLLNSDEIDAKYIEANYLGGMEQDDDEYGGGASSTMTLQPIDFDRLSRDPEFVFKNNDDINDILDKLKRGAFKRHSKTLLHDQIVRSLAEKFQSQGATVLEDPNSVDLLVKWPKGEEAIFEVKTVTRRSLQDRIRKAIGQIEEYSYRRTITGNPLTDRIIVINTEVEKDAWQIDFLNRHMGIGLICSSKVAYRAYAPSGAASKVYWK